MKFTFEEKRMPKFTVESLSDGSYPDYLSFSMKEDDEEMGFLMDLEEIERLHRLLGKFMESRRNNFEG